MNQKTLLLNIFALLMFAATPVFANNFTVSGSFDGTEPTMAADPFSCDGSAKRYRIAGTVSVSATGTYTIVDAGNWFPFSLPQSSIADTVIMIYAGSFNPALPSVNRVASVDEYGSVALSAGTSYVLVVQHWCEEYNGAYAILIDGGQATVSGDGFTSLPRTIANFNSGSPTANFDDLGGIRRYRSDAVTVSASGTYYLIDVGEEFGGSTMSLRVYKDSFDPLNPNANLVANTGGFFADAISLQAGVNYVFVLIGAPPDAQRVQYVLFPPGPFNFNPGLNGAWVSPGILKQGILMEVLPSAGILFFAQFTFDAQPLVASASTSSLTQQAAPESAARPAKDAKTQAVVGADDQVWLTAFGTLPSDGDYMTIKYENSTGGRFNSTTPAATTNSDYGDGWIEGVTCDHLIINWSLPGGIVDTLDYYKATQDAVPYCQSFIKAGPVSSVW